MKIPPLLPQVALVFAVAYACSDSAAPANSRALLTPKNPTAQFEEPPPPPVDVSIAITITSDPVTAIFTGVFFNNGLIHDEGGGVTPTFDGMAWLRFDNRQPDGVGGFFSGTTSANARFMVKGTETPTGHGTLTIGGVVYTIVQVFSFVRLAGCGELGEAPTPCAHIEFRVTDPQGISHGGHLVAFEESECLSEDKKGGLDYECPLPPLPEEDIG
jgi:hypothetical protein